MEIDKIWTEVFEVKDRLQIDEELFYSLLYDYLLAASRPTMKNIIRHLEMFMQHDFDGDTIRWRKAFHSLALAQLEKDIAALGLPVRRTANEMALREFAIDDARWLRCWQIARLVYLLKTKSLK